MNRFIHRSVGAVLLGMAWCSAIHAQTPARETSQHVRPLLDSRGEIEHPEPGAIPADPGHRTHIDLYATEAQARLLESTLAGQVVAVRVGCCGVLGIEDTVRQVWDAQVARELPSTAPVLVYGDDPWHAAQVVNRLEDKGLSRVFLVRVR